MDDTANVGALVDTYIKIRDAKDALVKEMEARVNELKEQLAIIESELLDVCKRTGQEGGKTTHGTFTRTVRTRYWSTDWDAMRAFIKEHDALDLMEQRIHQSNMKQFLQDNPGVVPEGLNVEAQYSIVVRRASK